MAMLLGRKVGMTQVYDESGKLLPVTVIQAGPCTVMQVKTVQTDGYNAVQLGYDNVKASRRKKPETGHAKKSLFSVKLDYLKDLDKEQISDELRQQFEQNKMPLSQDATVLVKKAGNRWLIADKSKEYSVRKGEDELDIYAPGAVKKFIREMRLPVDAEPEHEVGDCITVSVFAESEFVDIVGTSKGKGFAGVMKRHGFGGFPASHGTERKHRAPGSISSYASDAGHGGSPKRGKKMGGHMGHRRVTGKNHELVSIDEKRGLLAVKGPIPGPAGGYVVVRSSQTTQSKR